MSDVENLLDELNGRLTAVAIKYPKAEPFIESYRKHVRFALHNPERAQYGDLIKKGRKWLSEMMWKHPTFRPEFSVMVDRIDKFVKRGQ